MGRTTLKTWLAVVALFLILVLLSSCGASYHLRRMEHHKQKALEKGAKIQRDTLWKSRPIVIKGPTGSIPLNVVVNPSFRGQTSTIFKDTIVYRNKIKIEFRDRDIKVDCPDSTATIQVPVKVTETISAGFSWWDLLKMFLLGAVIGALLSKLLWK